MSNYNEALRVLAPYGPEYDEPTLAGLSNHGPMVAEAFQSLGREDLILPWARSYATKLAPMPEGTDPITAIDWQRSLGQLDRFSDWVGFFQRQLNWMSWDDLIAEWVPILAPGLAGAAGHGVLRTAHAVRGIEDEPTDEQRVELAHGLAYWASSFLPLPGSPLPRHATFDDTVDILTEVPSAAGKHHALISDALADLVNHEGIMRATVALDTSNDPLQTLGSIARAGGSMVVMNGSAANVFPLVHAITVPVSMLSLLPYVPGFAIAPALTYAWQFVVGIHAICEHRGDLHDAVDAPFVDDDELDSLVESAVESGDEHAIKLAEATLRIDRHDASGVPRAALRRGLELLL